VLLGGLDVKKKREDWPSYDDDGVGRVDYLRETKEHEELLYQFLRTVLLHDQYKRSKSKLLLSEYCHFSLEAYIVLTYYNWLEDAAADQMEQLNGAGGAAAALGMMPV